MNIGRYAKSIGKLLFDPKYSEVITNSVSASRNLNKARGLNSYHNFHRTIGNAFVNAEKATANTSIWKNFRSSATTLPKDLRGAWKASTGFKGKFGGIFKQLGKRMPLIGGALLVAFELPNLISAFKEKGLVGGLVETVKSTGRLCGSMAGFAIGQAIIPIPIVGGLIGAIAGDWLVSKITGKSHTEKKQEEQEKLAEAQQQTAMAQQQISPELMMPQQGTEQNLAYNNPNQTTPQQTVTPQQLMMMQQMLYGGRNAMNDDFMATASGMNKLNMMV